MKKINVQKMIAILIIGLLMIGGMGSCNKDDQSQVEQIGYMNKAKSIIANVSDSTEDYVRALEAFEKAIGYGCDSAYAYAAQFYEYGVGTMKDLEKATEYYKRGAEKNDSFCSHKLSLISNSASSRISFPDNANVKYQDLIVMADSVLTNVNGDGSFSCCNSSFVSVYNKDGQLIYCGYNNQTNGSFRLNSKTTAISILMFSYYLSLAFDGSVDISSFDNLWNMASVDSNVDSLSLIIDDIVVQNGFLDIDKFSTAFTNIAHKLADNSRNKNGSLSKNSSTGLSQDAIVIRDIHGDNEGIETKILKSNYNSKAACFDTQIEINNPLLKELYCYVTQLSNSGTPIIPDVWDTFMSSTMPSKFSSSVGRRVEDFDIKDGDVLVVTSPTGEYIPRNYVAAYVVWHGFGKIAVGALMGVAKNTAVPSKIKKFIESKGWWTFKPSKYNKLDLLKYMKTLVDDKLTQSAINEAIQANEKKQWENTFDFMTQRFITLNPTFFNSFEIFEIKEYNYNLYVNEQSTSSQTLFNDLRDLSLEAFYSYINLGKIIIVSNEKIAFDFVGDIVSSCAGMFDKHPSYYISFQHIHKEDVYEIRVYNAVGAKYSFPSEEIVFGSGDDRSMRVMTNEPSEYAIYIDGIKYNDKVEWFEGGGVGPGFDMVLPDLNKSVNVRIEATSHASRYRKTELNFSYRVDNNKKIVEQPIIEMPAQIEQIYESQVKNVTVKVANELCNFDLYIDDEHYIPNGVNLKNTHTITFPLISSEAKQHKLEVWAYPVDDGGKFTMSEPWYYDVVKQGQLVIKNPIAPNGDIYAGQEYSFGIRTDYGTNQISSTKYFTIDGKREGPYSGNATHTITFKAIDRPGVITVEASADQYKPASWSWYYTPTPRVKVTQKPASSVNAGDKIVIKAESDVVCDFEVVINGTDHLKGNDLKYSSDKAMEFEFDNTTAGNKYSFSVIAKTRADKNHPSKEGVSELMYVEVNEKTQTSAPKITSVTINDNDQVSNGETKLFDYDEKFQISVSTDVECETISIDVPAHSKRSVNNRKSYDSNSFYATESGKVTITATKNGKSSTFYFNIDVKEKTQTSAPKITEISEIGGNGSLQVENDVPFDVKTDQECIISVYDEKNNLLDEKTGKDVFFTIKDHALEVGDYKLKIKAKSTNTNLETEKVISYTVNPIRIANSTGNKSIKLNGDEYVLKPNTTDDAFVVDYRGKGIFRVYKSNGQEFGTSGDFYIYNSDDFESGLNCFIDICWAIAHEEKDGKKYYDLTVSESYRGVKLYLFECHEGGGYYIGPFSMSIE